jgi:uncharacterized protein (DUF1810 family)
MDHDPYKLQRYVEAQEPVFEHVAAELMAGRKTSHWIWFVFPQIEGLGHSAMARLYAIHSLEEAQAYLQHAVLGPRLLKCTALVNQIHGRSAFDIFGSPDDLKFRSCMSLFSQAAPKPNVFTLSLDRYFSGQPDPATMARLTL